MALLAAVAPARAQPAGTVFAAALGELPDAGFADKEAIITRLVETGHPSTGAVLTAMLEDRLYVRTSDRRVFITTSADDTQPAFSLLDPLTLKGAGSSPSWATSPRSPPTIASGACCAPPRPRFALSNPDAAVRVSRRSPTRCARLTTRRPTCCERLPQEPDAAVKREIETGLAMMALGDSDPKARLAAVQTSVVARARTLRNRLAALLSGRRRHLCRARRAVRKTADEAVRNIDFIRSLYSGVRNDLFGLSLGSALVLGRDR